MCAETYAYTNLYFDKFSEISFISLIKFQIFQKRFNYVHGVNKGQKKYGQSLVTLFNCGSAQIQFTENSAKLNILSVTTSCVI